jgi:hypothetical protein
MSFASRCARVLASMGSLEFTKVCVAGTAGSQMIEPILRFIERHLVTGNSLENFKKCFSSVDPANPIRDECH